MDPIGFELVASLESSSISVSDRSTAKSKINNPVKRVFLIILIILQREIVIASSRHRQRLCNRVENNYFRC